MSSPIFILTFVLGSFLVLNSAFRPRNRVRGAEGITPVRRTRSFDLFHATSKNIMTARTWDPHVSIKSAVLLIGLDPTFLSVFLPLSWVSISANVHSWNSILLGVDLYHESLSRLADHRIHIWVALDHFGLW